MFTDQCLGTKAEVSPGKPCTFPMVYSYNGDDPKYTKYNGYNFTGCTTSMSDTGDYWCVDTLISCST